MSAKVVIDLIRREYTGEGLEKNESWQSVVQNSNEALSGALKQLSENLYKKEFHFIMELIQNAEDNLYKSRTRPFISFTLFDDKLVVRNNETGFTEQNVRALCAVNKTTKKKIEGYIGEKGIGFKSVFKVSDRPEIYSNGFQFRLNSQAKSKTELKYILPEWIENTPDIVGPGLTNIVLPFKKHKQEKFQKQLEQIRPSLLLFLKKITRIEIIDQDSGDKRVLEKKIISDEIIRLSNYSKNWRGLEKTEHFYYLLKRFSCKVSRQISQKTEERKGLKETEVIIGFPLKKVRKGYQLLTGEDCDLYSYLPIKDVGFRFLIQADFILNSSREDIDESKSWNDWIKEKIKESIIKSLLSLRFSEIWSKYLCLLPRSREIKDETFGNLATEVIDGLINQKIIPVDSKDSLSWVSPEKALVYNSTANAIFPNEWIKKVIGKEFYHPAASVPSEIEDVLEIDEWEWEHVLSVLGNPNFILTLNESDRTDLYEYLSDYCGVNKAMLTELRDVPIFFVNDYKKPQSFNQREDEIFLPLETRFNYSFLKEIRFLTTKLPVKRTKRAQKIRDFLKSIGIKAANFKHIVLHHIIPTYELKDGQVHGKVVLNHVEYFRFLVENYSSLKSISGLIKTVRENLRFRIAGSDSFSKASDFYLGSQYQTAIPWEKFLWGEKVWYLHPTYIKGIDPSLKKDALRLLTDLGVEQQADFFHLIDCFNSKDSERMKHALVFLDKNWSYYQNKYYSNDLKNVVVIPFQGELKRPQDFFVPSKKNKRILANLVCYLPSYLKNKALIKDLKVNDDIIPLKYLEEVLRKMRSGKNPDKKLLIDIFHEVDPDDDRDPSIEFLQKKLIYCFEQKKWIYSWEAVWIIDNEDFRSIYSGMNEQYPNLFRFFRETLEINLTIEFSNILHYLESISGEDNITKEERNTIEHALVFSFSQLTKNSITFDELKKLKDFTFIPDQFNNLSFVTDAYFADDISLYSLFKGSDLSLFKLSKRNTGYKNSLRTDLPKIGMQLLSKAVSAKIINSKTFKQDSKMTEELVEIVKRISYVVYYRFKEIYKNLPEIKKDPANIKCLVSPKPVSVHYELKDESRTSEKEVFIYGANVYLKEFDKSKTDETLKIILFEYYENTEEVKDVIIHLLSVLDKQEAFQNYLKWLEIPLPKKSSDWNVTKEPAIKTKNHPEEKEEVGDLSGKKEEIRTERKPLPVPAKKPITIEPGEWKPGLEPEHIIEIEFAHETSGNEFFGKSGSSDKSGPVFFPSYRFNDFHGNESEKGAWGESFVFNNLVSQLKKQYPETSYIHNLDGETFLVTDKNNSEVASLRDCNADGITQSGYDMIRVMNGVTTFIEVKTTTYSGTARFVLRKEQWECCRQNPDHYELYFVKEAGTSNARIIHVPDFFNRFEKGQIKVTPHDLEIIL